MNFRSQIMRGVGTVAGTGIKHEKGLRSIANALRTGRFSKVRYGRLQVAEDSFYNFRYRNASTY